MPGNADPAAHLASHILTPEEPRSLQLTLISQWPGSPHSHPTPLCQHRCKQQLCSRMWIMPFCSMGVETEALGGI